MKSLDRVAMSEAIKRAISVYGVEILANRGRFESVIRDWLPDRSYMTEQLVLCFSIRAGIGGELVKAVKSSVTGQKRTLGFANAILSNECGLKKERCIDILAAFVSALDWNIAIASVGSTTAVERHKGVDDFDTIQKKDLYFEGQLISFGSYKWRVLCAKEEEVLLLSNEITDIGMPYNKESGDTSWAACSLRQWLNSEFLARFNEKQQKRILCQLVQAEHNPWYGTYAGNSIKDKVFLLSISEVVQYLGDSGALRSKPLNDLLDVDGSPFAVHDKFDAERCAGYKGENTWWWLRSPGDLKSKAAYVNANGSILLKGELACDNGGTSCVGIRPGVRPAIWIKK